VCSDFESQLVEFDGEDDHVHLLVNYPPKTVRDPNNGRRRPGFTLAPQKQSFDVITGSFDNMFDDEPHMERFILDPQTGSVLHK
jgi:REP element-mobilizing transposase RayT